MAGFSEKFQDGLIAVAEKVDDNKYLSCMKNAFGVYAPFVIVGSFGSLFNNLIASTSTGLAKWIPWLANLAPAFNAMNYACISFMAIPIVFLTAMNLARRNKVPEHVAGVLATLAYISMVPQAVTIGESSTSGLAGNVIGAQGLFVGMIIAIIMTEFFTWLTKIDKLKIKMPDSVPAMITTSFNVLIPLVICLVTSSVLGILFKLATGSYINEWIYAVVQAPMQAVFQNPIGVVLIVIFSQLFWFLGIHGGLVISAIRNPLNVEALAANAAAAAAGMTPNQPVTRAFWMNFVSPGGAGICVSLIFAILLFSKREDHRGIAKSCLLPGLLSISEPIVFGLPLVLNPIFAIPFILNSGIATAIGMFFSTIGFLPCNTIDIPFGLPIIISAAASHGWQGAVVQAIILVVCTATYAPFVLIANKMAEREKAKQSANE